MMKSILLACLALVLMVFAGCGTGPDAPSGLTVTSQSPITLTWTAVSGVKSYNVYRGTTSGGGSNKTRLNTSDITTTTYQDTTAVAGTTYYYQVTAVNSDGVSAASNEVSAVAQSSGNTFTVNGSASGSQIVLTWSAVSGAVTYNVWRGTTSATITNKIKIQSGITTTTFTDTGLSSGTYYYQVEAVNSSGIPFQVSTESSGLLI